MLTEDRALLVDGFAEHLDPAMVTHGFARGPKSLSFRRKLPAVEHRIDIATSRHPSYHRPTPWLHLHPGFHLRFADLEAVLQQLGLSGTRPWTISGTYELLTPDGERSDMVFVQSADELAAGVIHLRELIVGRVLPFLDRLRAPGDLVTLFRQGYDSRPPAWRSVHAFVDDHSYAAIAVAAVLTGQPEVATRVLERDLARRSATEHRAALKAWIAASAVA